MWGDPGATVGCGGVSGETLPPTVGDFRSGVNGEMLPRIPGDEPVSETPLALLCVEMPSSSPVARQFELQYT